MSTVRRERMRMGRNMTGGESKIENPKIENHGV
jgi:hypothetical protein